MLHSNAVLSYFNSQLTIKLENIDELILEKPVEVFEFMAELF